LITFSKLGNVDEEFDAMVHFGFFGDVNQTDEEDVLRD
jgi:hypothetical protein